MESSCIFNGDYENNIQYFFKNFWKFIKLFFQFFLYLYDWMEKQLRNFPRWTVALANHCAELAILLWNDVIISYCQGTLLMSLYTISSS